MKSGNDWRIDNVLFISMAITFISYDCLYGGGDYMIEIFEIFWSSPIELRVIILACLLTPVFLKFS